MAELKPCPFCGGNAKICHGAGPLVPYSYIRCDGCGIKTPAFNAKVDKASDEEAAEVWNRRADNG